MQVLRAHPHLNEVLPTDSDANKPPALKTEENKSNGTKNGTMHFKSLYGRAAFNPLLATASDVVTSTDCLPKKISRKSQALIATQDSRTPKKDHVEALHFGLSSILIARAGFSRVTREAAAPRETKAQGSHYPMTKRPVTNFVCVCRLSE